MGIKVEHIFYTYNKKASNSTLALNDVSFEKAGHRSVSIGVIEIQKGESADSAYVRVDQALYKAKENGRDQVFQA